jgi:hypothetical protein
MRGVSSYFKSVSKEMRPILMAVDELKEKEAREAIAAEKVIVEKEKRARILAGYAKANAERKRKRIEQAGIKLSLLILTLPPSRKSVWRSVTYQWECRRELSMLDL